MPPPIDQEREGLTEANSANSVAEQWQLKYLQARQSEDSAACPLFIDLSKEKDFALAELALLRARLTCTQAQLDLFSIEPVDLQQVESWQKPLVVETRLNRALVSKDPKDLSQWAFEKSKFFLPTHEKLYWTEQALVAAETLQDADQVLLLKKRREDLAPRFIVKPRQDQWLDVAYDLRKNREFDRARKQYEQILRTKTFSFDDHLRALQGLRMTDKNSRAKEDYLASSERKARFVFDHYRLKKKSSSLQLKLLEVYIDLMRTYWTEGQVTKAAQVLKFLEKELKAKTNIGDVYWLRGRMSEEKQDFAQAQNHFKQALGEKNNTSEQKEKYLWHLGWSQRKLKNYAQAQLTFKELKELTTNDFQRAKYHFWLAESLNDLSLTGEARAEFLSLIEQDPLGYYGMMAHRQIGLPLKKPKPVALTQTSLLDSSHRTPSSLEHIFDPALTEWLLRVEDQKLCQTYLDAVAQQYKQRDDQTAEGWLSLFHSLARAGSYLQLFELLGQLKQESRSEILVKWPEVLFPRPYLEIVKTAEQQFGVGQDIIYAIMRQESAFNPTARSWADAFGLLQMLPEVARKMLPLNDITQVEDEDLFKPEVNILLGSAFIKKLLDKYEGRFVLTVAAYNASDRAIQGWIKSRYQGHSLEFIEDIPYEETKGYVKLVMRNLVFYRLLESSEAELKFPAELLNI